MIMMVVSNIFLIFVLQNKITMGRVKEIYLEIQEKLGEDVEVTEEVFTQHLIEKGIYKEDNSDEEE
jgi:hypothetical protein